MAQWQEIVAMLEDGPKTTREILQQVPCIVHSRISDLRIKHGYDIVCERIAGEGAGAYLYTLRGTETDGGDAADSVPRSVLTASAPSPPREEGSGQEGLSAASSGPSPQFDTDDLQLELDLIDRRLCEGMTFDSENARSTRAVMQRQRGEIEEKLARVA